MKVQIQRLATPLVFAFGIPIYLLMTRACSSDWLTGAMTAYLALLNKYHFDAVTQRYMLWWTGITAFTITWLICMIFTRWKLNMDFTSSV
jgi:hypothetical protein